MTPEISIVVGTKNRYSSMCRFWESVYKTASIPTELIVADAGDTLDDFLPAFCHASDWNLNFKWHRFHESPPLGTVRGYNAAFRMATGRYVMWANDDCEMISGWDRIAIDFMDSHKDVGLGILYFKDQGMAGYYVQEQPLGPLGNIVTANFGIVPRWLGNEVGWFDEREVFIPEIGRSEALTHYGCDNSICLSILNRGFGVVQIPNCKIIHHREVDETRREKMDAHMNCAPLLPGSKSGRILSLLWNGDDPAFSGYARLKATSEKFRHLIGPIHIGD